MAIKGGKTMQGGRSIGRLEFEAVALSEKLRAGSIGRAEVQKILHYFCETVRLGKQPSFEVIECLAAAFGRYLGGESSSLDKALGLTRARAGNPGSGLGKRRLKNDDERVELALQIVGLMNGGVSYEKAIEQARGEFYVSKKTAESCYSEHAVRIVDYAQQLIKSGEGECDAIQSAARAFSVPEKFARRAFRRRRAAGSTHAADRS
jgi:hypothetical protein